MNNHKSAKHAHPCARPQPSTRNAILIRTPNGTERDVECIRVTAERSPIIVLQVQPGKPHRPRQGKPTSYTNSGIPRRAAKSCTQKSARAGKRGNRLSQVLLLGTLMPRESVHWLHGHVPHDDESVATPTADLVPHHRHAAHSAAVAVGAQGAHPQGDVRAVDDLRHL